MIIKQKINLKISGYSSPASYDNVVIKQIFEYKKLLEKTYNIVFTGVVLSNYLNGISTEFINDDMKKQFSVLKHRYDLLLNNDEIIFTSNDNEFNNFERILKIQDIEK